MRAHPAPRRGLAATGRTFDYSKKSIRNLVVYSIIACLAIDILTIVTVPEAGIVISYLLLAVVLLWIEADYWPVVAAVQVILLPVSYMSQTQLVQVLPPAMILVVAYLSRQSFWFRRPMESYLWLALIIYAFALIPLSSSADLSRKFAWVILLAVAGGAALSAVSMRTSDGVLTAICASGLVAATLGIVEYYFRYNPLDEVYANGQFMLVQKWETYRVFSTLGHPLVNGLVYALAFAACLVRFTSQPQLKYAMAMVVVVLGCAVSASRSSALAIGAATIVCALLYALHRRWRQFAATLTVLVAGSLAYLLLETPLHARSLSEEGRGSSLLREQYIRSLGELMSVTDYLGTGLGASSRALSEVGGSLSRYPIESSFIQIAVGLGVVGLILFIALITIILTRWAVSGAVAGVVLMVSYGTAATGFNMLEAYPALFALLPLVLVIGNGALSRREHYRRHTRDSARAEAV